MEKIATSVTCNQSGSFAKALSTASEIDSIFTILGRLVTLRVGCRPTGANVQQIDKSRNYVRFGGFSTGIFGLLNIPGASSG